ncbi:N-acetylgalactosamine-6-sulfatase [Microtetraspora sp. NBRC 13810]|nr:N-acetylgalactosamine-6-sulfatase [Microtetraspora sp. NBRC 13810]
MSGTAWASAARGASSLSLPAKPNFVIILADDLGWGEIGCYGQKMIKTPHLNRLAAEGLRFTSAYSGAPLCAPSRAALLTGLHTGHTTVRENPEGGEQHDMSVDDLTFAGLLQMAGYRTALFGKWGFGPERPDQPSHPNSRGFDEFFGFIDHQHAHQYYPSYLWHNGQKVSLGRKYYAPDLFLKRAKDFIKRNADEPFLLYFPTILPHSPSVVPDGAGQYENKPWTRANRLHAAQVTRLDSHVAQIVQALKDAGVSDSTLVLFISDNGPHREKGVTPWLFNSNGPYRADKRDLYEGGIRTPMIAWSPALSRQGEVADEQVASWDIMPTLADLAGLPVPDNLDGISFKGVLDGSGYEGHDLLFWNRPRKAQAIRRGRWKAVRFAPHIAGAGSDGRFELYDLDNDRGETHNLAKIETGIAAELDELMNQSVGPDPRSPYGLRVASSGPVRYGEPHEFVVTLHNGSAQPWDGVRLRLEVPSGWRVEGGAERQLLEPGGALRAAFTVTPPAAGGRGRTQRLVPRARFAAQGRTVSFQKLRPVKVHQRADV